MKRVGIVLFLLFVLGQSQVKAATLYVAINGNDVTGN